jgi:hypothetical protein
MDNVRGSLAITGLDGDGALSKSGRKSYSTVVETNDDRTADRPKLADGANGVEQCVDEC